MEDIKIEEVKDIIYIGTIIHKQTSSKSKWKLEYECSKEIQKKESGRIYFIVVNGLIYKIGQSSCKGGIKNTFTFYEGGLGGSPSIRTFGIHLLIQEQLDLGKEIKIYILFIEEIKVKIRGLTTEMEVTTCPDIKTMESRCLTDYKNIYKKYPVWNFQENGEELPDNIKQAFKEQVQNRK